MFNFNKKNDDDFIIPKEKLLKIQYDNNRDRYIFNMLSLLNKGFDYAQRDDLGNEYDSTIDQATAIIDNFFGVDLLNQSRFDFYYTSESVAADFAKKLNENPKISFFLDTCSINGNVRIIDSSESKFIVKNNIIVEVKGISQLLSRNNYFNSENFDNMFIGKNIEWAYELLKQMRLITRTSELEERVTEYKSKNVMQNGFFESIICKLLIRDENKELNVNRAILIAYYFGISFDFSNYISKNNNPVLKMVVNNS